MNEDDKDDEQNDKDDEQKETSQSKPKLKDTRGYYHGNHYADKPIKLDDFTTCHY